MKKVITYGSFDLFHEGHFRLLQRAKALEDIDARYVGLLKFSKGGLEHILTHLTMVGLNLIQTRIMKMRANGSKMGVLQK